jgi:hypothetical protein
MGQVYIIAITVGIVAALVSPEAIAVSGIAPE